MNTYLKIDRVEESNGIVDRPLTTRQSEKYFDDLTKTPLANMGISKISHDQYTYLLYGGSAKNKSITQKSSKHYLSSVELYTISEELMNSVKTAQHGENFNCAYCSIVIFNETSNYSKIQIYLNIHLFYDDHNLSKNSISPL